MLSLIVFSRLSSSISKTAMSSAELPRRRFLVSLWLPRSFGSECTLETVKNSPHSVRDRNVTNVRDQYSSEVFGEEHAGGHPIDHYARNVSAPRQVQRKKGVIESFVTRTMS